MRPRQLFILLSMLLCAISLRAEDVPWSITPSSGPTTGGTQVTIKGNFGFWPYGLILGGTGATATRVDEHTLIAVTPPHPAGTVDVAVFEYDIGISTDLKFTYTASANDPFERVLLPIFTPPAKGLFGSEFHSELHVWNSLDLHDITLFGVEYSYGSADDPVTRLREKSDAILGRSAENYSGNPARFVFIRRGDFDQLGAHLRVFDVTRNAESFGTEIPIVREREFDAAARIAFPAVPVDPRFRTTLRIYALAATTVRVTVGDQVFDVPVLAGRNIYEPAYAVLSNFPSGGTGAINVTIDPPTLTLSPVTYGPPIWALLTITNNDTQQITTMSPQR